MESLIFDVDGTLWDAVALVAEGWNDGLQSMGFAPHCTEQSIRPLFGKTMTEIAQVVVPGVPQEQAMEVMDRCMDGEMARLRRDPCHIFYPGVTCAAIRAIFSTPASRKRSRSCTKRTACSSSATASRAISSC